MVSEHLYSFTPFKINVSSIIIVFPCLDSFVPKLMQSYMDDLKFYALFLTNPWNEVKEWVSFLYSQQEEWKQNRSSLQFKNQNICRYCGCNLVSFPESEENIVSDNRHRFGINRCPKPLPVITPCKCLSSGSTHK